MSHATNLRPQSLDELVGNDNLKQKARIAIGAALMRGEPLSHVLLTSSGGGLGKTTFGFILANEMFSPLITTTGQCLFTALDLRRILLRLKPNSLLMIDEFHCIGQMASEELLLVLEEGVLNVNIGTNGPTRMELPPFTLIAATTKPSSIAEALMQRFALQFHFDFYSVEELIQIVKRMESHLGIEFEHSVCRGIAERSHGVVRKCLHLARRVRDVVQVNKGGTRATKSDLEVAMTIENIDCLGLRDIERRLLTVLAKSDPRPVSVRSLALALGTETSNVRESLEPLLARLGLISIGPGGRKLTELGYAHLKRVNQAEVNG